MRIVAILVVLAIVYFVFARQGPVESATKAVAQAEAIAPAPVAPVTAAPTPTALRRPLVRTRETLDQVKQRNEE